MSYRYVLNYRIFIPLPFNRSIDYTLVSKIRFSDIGLLLIVNHKLGISHYPNLQETYMRRRNLSHNVRFGGKLIGGSRPISLNPSTS